MSRQTVLIAATIVFELSQVSFAELYVDPWSEFAVAVDQGRQCEPAIWGDWVVWYTYDKPWPEGRRDVYAKNLSSQEKIRLNSVEGAFSPDIHENLVVWSQLRDGDADIYAYDLEKRTEFVLYDGPGDQLCPVVYGDTVVWGHRESVSAVPGELWGYSIEEDRAFLISGSPGKKWYPDIWGDVVVWGDYRAGNWDVYGYDLSNGSEFSIASGPADQRSAAVYGDIVAYEHETQGVGMYNLLTGENWLHEIHGHFDWIEVYGDIVVWGDWRGNSGYDIYGYSIEEQVEFRVCVSPAHQSSPAIYENIVVWSDDRLGGYDHGDIYGNTIVPEPSTALLLGLSTLALSRRRRTRGIKGGELKVSGVGIKGSGTFFDELWLIMITMIGRLKLTLHYS